MFVYLWGSVPGTTDPDNHLACLYVVTRATGAVVSGPCLSNFGVGDNAQSMDVNQVCPLPLLFVFSQWFCFRFTCAHREISSVYVCV